jgi:addiction module HigA family antidote
MKPPMARGEILLGAYLTPRGIPQNVRARAIGVAPRAINEIVLGHRAITPVMSIRCGAFFGQTPALWHGLQIECVFPPWAKGGKSSPPKSTPP